MRRFLIIGFILALLIAAPIVAYFLIKQPTTTTSHANPASSLVFEDTTAPAVVGQKYPVKLDVNPASNGSTNAVSFVKFSISYDGSKLQADNSSFVSSASFPVTLEGPTNACTGTACTMSGTLSIGPDPTKAVNSQTLVGTITFTPLAATDANAPVSLDFVQGQNQILSLATTDQPAENVFTRGIPATITIVTAEFASGTPLPTSPGGQPTDTSAPGQPTNTPPPGGSTNQPPVCNTLTLTQDSTDGSGMTYQLDVKGTDSDGTISKVSFNFGDGNVSEVTTGATLGTANVNTTTSHKYTSGGTYTVSALLTDNANAISTPSTCKKSITAGSAVAQANDTPTTVPSPTPTTIPNSPSTIPPTGPGNTLIGIGLAGAVLVVLGGLFLMGL